MDRAVAAVRDGDDAAAVATAARAVLARLRQAIGQLHESAAGPPDVGTLGARVVALGEPAAAPRPGVPTTRGLPPGAWRPVVPVAVLFAVGLADALAEAGWLRPAVLLPVGLLAVLAPVPWPRRFPLVATVAVCALLTGFAALVTPVAPLLAGNLLLLLPYAVARHRGRLGALAGSVVILATAAVVVVVAGADPGADDWPTTALLVLAAAGAGLLVRREVALAVELRAATAELAEEQARAEELVRRGRRLEVARDLHDAVAHSVTVVALQAAAAARVWDDDPARAAEHLAALRATTTETLAELGRLARRLPVTGAPGLAELPAWSPAPAPVASTCPSRSPATRPASRRRTRRRPTGSCRRR